MHIRLRAKSTDLRFTLPGGTAIPEMIDIDHISAFNS